MPSVFACFYRGPFTLKFTSDFNVCRSRSVGLPPHSVGDLPSRVGDLTPEDRTHRVSNPFLMCWDRGSQKNTILTYAICFFCPDHYLAE